MLETKQHTNKLVAAHVDFATGDMQQGTCLSEALKTFLSARPDDNVEMDIGLCDEVIAENAGAREGEGGTEPTWDYRDVVEGS